MRSLVTRTEAKVGVVKLVTLHVCGWRGMMMNLVHQQPPRPQERELPGAANSGSENTSPRVESALMLKSPPMKSTECRIMCSRRRCKREIDASRFLATLL